MRFARADCDNGSWAGAAHLRLHGTVLSENHLKGGEGERGGGREWESRWSAVYLVYGGGAIIRQDMPSLLLHLYQGKEGGEILALYSIVYSMCHQCVSIEWLRAVSRQRYVSPLEMYGRASQV